MGAAVAIMFSAACTGGMVYHHYEQAPKEGLSQYDTLHFAVKPMAKADVLHEEVELRIGNDFNYQGLSLVVEQTTLPSGHFRRDTLNCSLIDEDGMVKGTGRNVFQYHFHLTDISLEKGDSLDIAIHHIMRREVITGIRDIGISLSSRKVAAGINAQEDEQQKGETPQ